MSNFQQFLRRIHRHGSLSDTDTGNKTYSGTLLASGGFTASGANTMSGATTFSAAVVNSSTLAQSGVATFTGKIVNKPITTNQFEGLDNRYRLVWIAGQQGLPGVNGDILNASEAVNAIADKHFEVLGSGATTDDVTYYAEGGITLTTDGGGTNGVTLLPHLDAEQTPWTGITWGSDKQVRWECLISTASNIADIVIFAGLKLTNTAVTATDADQVFFRFAPGVQSGVWEAITSVANTDDAHNTTLTVLASTLYHLLIDIDASRVPKFYINGVLRETGSALTDTTDFIPYIGVLESTGTGKVLQVHAQAISRVIG